MLCRTEVESPETSASGSLAREVVLVRAKPVLAIGTLAFRTLAIAQRLDVRKLHEAMRKAQRVRFMDQGVDGLTLPHPLGLSSGCRKQTLASFLREALSLIDPHPS